MGYDIYNRFSFDLEVSNQQRLFYSQAIFVLYKWTSNLSTCTT